MLERLKDFTAPKGWCSSVGRRRRPACSAPRSAADPTVTPTHGSCGQPGSSISSTSTVWTPISGRSSSSSAPTSPTPRSSASTVTTGRNAKQRRQGSGSPRWTTPSPPSMTRPGYRRSVTGSGPAAIQALLNKWLALLPNPFTDADRHAGYRYQLSMLQTEFSLTQMLDAPVTGRVFFEQVIRDNLDIGRPDRVSLIFDRKRVTVAAGTLTPGQFRTRVITEGRHTQPARGVQDHPDQAVPQVATRGRTLRADSQSGGPTDVGGVVPGRCSMVRARSDVRRR